MSTTSYDSISPEVVRSTTTSWLPITTAFPSLEGCAQALFRQPNQLAPVAWHPGLGYLANNPMRCVPPEVTSSFAQAYESPSGYTSISIQPIVCPMAYTTAATQFRYPSSTLVRCCPSGYQLSDTQRIDDSNFCTSPLSSGQTITFWEPLIGSSYVVHTSTITEPWDLIGFPIDGWNVAHSTSVGTEQTSNSDGPTTPSINVGNNTRSETTASNQLSPGSIAGVSIAACFASIAFCGLIVLLVRKYRTRKGPIENYEMLKNLPRASFIEAQSSQILEMPGKPHQIPAELDTRS